MATQYSQTKDAWRRMIKRCESTEPRRYRNYGGRGITVCSRWYDFANFLADMGFRPDGLTLERNDPNGNYEPGNCSWADLTQQRRNQRRVKLSAEIAAEIRSSTLDRKELAKIYGVTKVAIGQVIRREIWV